MFVYLHFNIPLTRLKGLAVTIYRILGGGGGGGGGGLTPIDWDMWYAIFEGTFFGWK